MQNFRRFEASDPYGRTWQVEFRWQQNAISIRHSDSVDVKFQLMQAHDVTEKVVALKHPDLLSVSKKTGRALSDSWAMKLAALHLKEMIETDRDMEKILVSPSADDLERYSAKMEAPVPLRR